MEIVCPLCGKRAPESSPRCPRCGTDFELLLELRRAARQLLEAGHRHREQGAVRQAEQLYRESRYVWDEVGAPAEVAGPSTAPDQATQPAPVALPLPDVAEQPTPAQTRPAGVAGFHAAGPAPQTRWLTIGFLLAVTVSVAALGLALSQHRRLAGQREQLVALQQESTSLREQASLAARDLARARASLEVARAVAAAYRFLNTRDVEPFLRRPELVVTLDRAQLDDVDRAFVERARRAAALRLFQLGTRGSPPDRVAALAASVALWPSGYHVDDAYYLMARLTEESDPRTAMALYEKALSIPYGPWYHDDSLLAIGRLQLKLGDVEGAIESWRTLQARFPSSEGARLAGLYLKRLKALMRRR